MISILVAYTKKDRIIGDRGVIPWHIPSDRSRFKEICKDKFIIMGRKSFDEIGHRLPYCTIIIISRTLKNAPEGCLLAKSLVDGIELARNYSDGAQVDDKHINENQVDDNSEILIAGGGEIYRQALNMAETCKIYATEIDENFKGDVTFPPLGKEWEKTSEAQKSELGINFKYVIYER